MKLNFGQEVLCLPATALSAQSADAIQLRVLLWLASDLSLAEKPRQLATLAGCDLKTAKAALKYWCDCGVLAADGAEDATAVMATVPTETKFQPAEKPKKTLLRRADELPNYTSTELSTLLEQRATLRALVDESQQIIGKMFNPSELNVIVTMFDYLGICEEGILMILAHCKRVGKINMRSVEKYAYSLVDKGITEPADLEEEFRMLALIHSFEGEVRKMFGMKSRALTSRESKMLRTWVSYGYGIDVIQHAYELTINAINEPSLPYASSIMERWNAEGMKTLDDIMNAEAEAQKAKAGSTTLGKSFEADDFFEAALKRSFRETGVDGEV